jgi:hypothetical protein
MSRGPAPAVPQKPAPAGTLAGKLAILELRNFAKDLARENAQYFTDLVRGAALKSQPQLQVMTREELSRGRVRCHSGTLHHRPLPPRR